MKDLAIAVLGYNRPECLHICLDSIARAGGTDVYLYFDGPLNEEFMARTAKTIYSFNNVEAFHVSGKRIGIQEAHLLAFRETFNLGYERVLFLEEDLIIRKDAIEWVKNFQNIRGFFLSLTHYDTNPSEYDIGGFNTQGVVLTRRNFDLLDDQIRTGSYWGLDICEKPACFWYDTITNFDGIWYALSKKNSWVMQRSPISRVAHFGVRNCFPRHEGAEDKADKFRVKIFSGERSTWLDNLLYEFKHHDDIDPDISKWLYPKWFEYE